MHPISSLEEPMSISPSQRPASPSQLWRQDRSEMGFSTRLLDQAPRRGTERGSLWAEACVVLVVEWISRIGGGRGGYRGGDVPPLFVFHAYFGKTPTTWKYTSSCYVFHSCYYVYMYVTCTTRNSVEFCRKESRIQCSAAVCPLLGKINSLWTQYHEHWKGCHL